MIKGHTGKHVCEFLILNPIFWIMDNNKSYIIWWITRSGKSQLCSKIHKDLWHSWIECDFLISALQKRYKNLGISHDIKRDLGAKRFTQLTNHYFKSLLHNKGNKVVVDSYHLHPKYIDDLVRENYNILFVGYSNADINQKVEAILAYDRIHHGWTEEFSKERITERVWSRIKQSQELESLCKKYWFDFFDLSDDYENSLLSVYDKITR